MPESQAHYKGNPFHTADFVSFASADAITALTFHYEEVDNLIDQDKEESDIHCILDIDDSRIRHSEIEDIV